LKALPLTVLHGRFGSWLVEAAGACPVVVGNAISTTTTACDDLSLREHHIALVVE
jgi:hypothetical protein